MSEIKIIADEMTEKALRRWIDLALDENEEFEMKNVILIYVNVVFSSDQTRTDNIGLKIAKDLVKDETNVIILAGYESKKTLQKRDDLLSALLAYPNVEYIDILNLKEIVPAYQRITSGKKVLDKTTIALYEFKEWEKKLAELRHVIHRIESNPQKLEKWLEDAKKAGITGTDEEILNFVRNWKPGTVSKFEGKELEGVFVDAFETLFDENWNLIPSVQSAVEKLSMQKSKPIFVISDSEKTELKKRLDKNNINWPLLSKFDIRGANLELVIDNLTQEEFENRYDIKSREFINVQELKIS